MTISMTRSLRRIEQPVSRSGGEFAARLVRVELNSPARDGDTSLEILTNLPPAVTAVTVADAYRQRWQIETVFFELDRVFKGEIKTLAHPGAAVMAFCLSLLAYNALRVVRTALVLNVVGLGCLPCSLALPLPTLVAGVAGLVLGTRELRRIRRGEGPERGRTQAQGALWLGALNVALSAGWMGWVMLPTYLA